MDGKQQGYLVAGGIGALVMAILFYNFVTDDEDDGATKTTNNAITCSMTAAAVPLFVAAVSEGRAGRAVEGIAGVFTDGACIAVLKQLQSSPNTPVPIEVETPQDLVQRDVTLPDLTSPPPQPPPTDQIDLENIFACISSYSDETESFLLQLCYDGLIQPRTS